MRSVSLISYLSLVFLFSTASLAVDVNGPCPQNLGGMGGMNPGLRQYSNEPKVYAVSPTTIAQLPPPEKLIRLNELAAQLRQSGVEVIGVGQVSVHIRCTEQSALALSQTLQHVQITEARQFRTGSSPFDFVSIGAN